MYGKVYEGFNVCQIYNRLIACQSKRESMYVRVKGVNVCQSKGT